jgi:rod shape-determining protein MreD
VIKAPSRGIVLGSFLIGVLFEILPLPQVLQPFRPWLLAMLLMYWAIEAPLMVGFGAAFLLGLLADLASASLLGEQAMRLVLIVSLVQRFRARLRFFPLWQQAVAVGMLLFVDRAAVAILHLVFGLPQMQLANLFAPVVAIFLWPWLYVLIDLARLRARERS